MKYYLIVAALVIVGFGISLYASAQETCKSRYTRVGFSTVQKSGYTCKTTYWFNR